MKIVKLDRTSLACPAQWAGKLDDGRMIYIRYRHGWLSIRVSREPTKDIFDAVGGNELLGQERDGGGGGFLAETELWPILKELGMKRPRRPRKL